MVGGYIVEIRTIEFQIVQAFFVEFQVVEMSLEEEK